MTMGNRNCPGHGEDGGGTIFIRATHCEHDEPFICVTDLLRWMAKLNVGAHTNESLRTYLVREISLMGLHSDLVAVEEGETWGDDGPP